MSVDPADLQRQFAGNVGAPIEGDFRFIPDTSRNLSVLYRAADDIGDISNRQSILIDKAGIVRMIDREVSVGSHGSDVLDKMRQMGLAKPVRASAPR